MKSPRTLLALAFAALCGLVGTAHAATVITVNFSANQSGSQSDYATLGFTYLGNYSISFTIPTGIANNGNSSTGAYGTGNGYRSDSAAQGTYFSSISSAVLGGSYVAASGGNRFEDLGVYMNGGNPYMYITARDRTGGAIGLKMPNSTTDISGIQFYVNGSGFEYDFPETYLDPAVFFKNNLLSPSNGVVTSGFSDGVQGMRFDLEYGDDTSVSFGVTGFSVTTAAVPEPSTYALLAGAAALGLVIFRRRRAAAR